MFTKIFKRKSKPRLTASERANELLNSRYSFGRITTIESKSIDYKKSLTLNDPNKKVKL